MRSLAGLQLRYMADNPCMEFFETHHDNKQKVKELVDDGRGEEWLAEGLRASSHSPGIVSEQEIVVRQVHSPLHWDPVAKVVKLGFYDDLTNKGLSVNRLIHADVEVLSNDSADRAQSSNREAIGFVKFPASTAGEVTAAVSDGAVGVFDTALEKDKSHADVCQIKGDRAAGRALRQRMFQALKDCIHHGRLTK